MDLATLASLASCRPAQSTSSRRRSDVAAALGVDPETLDLSMGMSGDFEQAVRGACCVLNSHRPGRGCFAYGRRGVV